ncbi:MAG: flagellar transcriptional regulator FlhD [Burkholderiales bacterium]|jgi:flagellar transcriptional activator FlhD|nr:flagellar transcriptional regulator FlhD [Burkholderiales bacterium]
MSSQAANLGTDLSSEVRELNVAYLLLAQKMIKNDSLAAQVQLGIPEGVVEKLGSMTFTQALRIASTPMVICAMRFDDAKMWDVMTDERRDQKLARLHTAILSVCQPVLED